MRPNRNSVHSRSSRRTSGADPDYGDASDESGFRSYALTGCFAADFAGLCRERGMPFVPDVVPRPKWPAKPPKPRLISVAVKADQKTVENDVHGKKAKPPPKKRQKSESERISCNPSMLPVIETPPIPKTKFEFFKPSVQVDQDEPDDDRTVTEVYIRGWKVDVAMMEVLKRCLPVLCQLRLLHLWNAGLSQDTVGMLATFLPLCTHLTTLQLDGNSLAGAPLGQLVGPGMAPLRHLSLRFCAIGDTELEQLADRVGWMHAHKQYLVMLDLTGNQIGDKGVAILAESLKTNHTLGAINLTANRVGNQGAASLAQACTWFPVQGKLFLTRSQLLHEQLETELSSTTSKPEEDESNNAKTKSPKLHQQKISVSAPGSKKPSREKLGIKSPKRTNSCELKRHLNPFHLKMVTSIILPTLTLFSNFPRHARSRPPDRFMDGGVPIAHEGSHPLLSCGYLYKGLLWVPGNRTLHNLNLSRNQVGEEGIKALLTVVEEQTLVLNHVPKGLQRLELANNRCPANNPHLQRLMRIMQLRNPHFPSPFINLLKDSISPCSLPTSVFV